MSTINAPVTLPSIRPIALPVPPFPVPPEDEWVVVRAIAYSGLPDWRVLLRKVAPKMPGGGTA